MSIEQVTAIVKTLERPRSLQKLIHSIRRYYPQMTVLVGDDSSSTCLVPDIECLRLPTDCGASAGRNRLLEHVKTPYFLQLDDDFCFTDHTQIEILVNLLLREEIDLAAGEVINCKRHLGLFTKRRRSRFHGVMTLQQRHLTIERRYHAECNSFGLCDIVPQLFVARLDKVLSMGGWDEELKTQEHEEFFVRAQRQGLRVAHVPAVTVEHWQTRPPHYAAFRDRCFLPRAAEKMGIDAWTHLDGQQRDFRAA